jgi:stearoyl-CoA desaturase (delta-9 desaturase)
MSNPSLYAKDLLRDPTIAKINQFYPLWIILGLAIPAAIGGLATQTWIGAVQGFLWGGLVRVFLVHHMVWAVNSFAHVYGDRPFESDDCSTNNVWLALPSIGGAWHNNHHAFPYTARNSFEWWQIDLGSWFIRLLESCGCVWDVRMPTPEAIAAKKSPL